MSKYVDLDEMVTAQFYDQEREEWTMQTVTIEDVLDSVCDEYTVLPSAQTEPKCADGCLYGFGSDECEGCLFTTVKPKTGHWHITDAYPHNVYCSECYTRFAQTHWAVWEDGSLPRKFCPNCGARMDKE